MAGSQTPRDRLLYTSTHASLRVEVQWKSSLSSAVRRFDAGFCGALEVLLVIPPDRPLTRNRYLGRRRYGILAIAKKLLPIRWRQHLSPRKVVV
jgi:hypothetical protein